ncbi:MAG: adenylate/guanylate cyclase domain-containing protein [Phaeospirillum sp.]|nr:adenylate/guanylate cyclase domain-containing protein [Phaeospirillum sp.]
MSVILTRSCGSTIAMAEGASVLEALHRHGIAHASVCGGKARCTTCRVRVLSGQEALGPPGPLEVEALARIGAPAEVRLACQLRPTADLTVMPLLPADATMGEVAGSGGLDGRECEVAVLFVDLRDSTSLGEARMPYDVLFILNRFFLEMNRALVATGGHYSNFTGDGLMALYGLDGGDPAQAVRDALAGARLMLDAVGRVNKDLATELPQPLRIGIGLHVGEAIVGSMGPPGSQIISAIGDTVNIAARLEGLTKDYDCVLVLSRTAADMAGPPPPADRLRSVTVKGRSEAVEVYACDRVPMT